MKNLWVIALVFLCLTGLSCIMTYHGYARKKLSSCIYLIPSTMQIGKTCDEDATTITELKIDGRYDTVRMIDGKPNSFYPVISYKGEFRFPLDMDSLVTNKIDSIYIHFFTGTYQHEYNLLVKPSDWKRKDTLFFTYYYNQ